MRIALACPYAWDATGGVQVHVRQLAARLLARGHTVMVLAPASASPDEPHVVAVGRPIPVPYNGSVAQICPTRASAFRVRRALKEFRPEIIHAHEPLIPGTARFAALSGGAPVVATFHAYADRALLFSVVAPLLRVVWRRIRVRIAVSEAAASFVSRRFRQDDIRIIPNGADVEAFAHAEPARLPKGRRILFVNRLDRRKGFSDMVQAFALILGRHPEARLVVAGEGRQRRALRQVPADVRERVVMLGNVPHDRLPPYHAACEVFCAPARGRESFGIVLVEAMAAGLPVVASDIPGYREVVRDDAEGILVPPSDPRRLADAVVRLLDEPDLARTMGAAGRARAHRYSWDRVAREVEAVYEEALAGR